MAKSTKRIVEPFASFAYFSLLCAEQGFMGDFWLDFYDDVKAHLFRLIIESPEYVSESYEKLWQEQFGIERSSYFNHLKEKYEYNDLNQKALLLLFLLQKSKKDFTEDKTTYGRKPKDMSEDLKRISFLMKGRIRITVNDADVYQKCGTGDTYFFDNMSCIDENIHALIEKGSGFIMILDKDMGEKRKKAIYLGLKNTSNIHYDYINNAIYSKGADSLEHKHTKS